MVCGQGVGVWKGPTPGAWSQPSGQAGSANPFHQRHIIHLLFELMEMKCQGLLSADSRPIGTSFCCVMQGLSDTGGR